MYGTGRECVIKCALPTCLYYAVSAIPTGSSRCFYPFHPAFADSPVKTFAAFFRVSLFISTFVLLPKPYRL